jgi:hypothetical protein
MRFSICGISMSIPAATAEFWPYWGSICRGSLPPKVYNLLKKNTSARYLVTFGRAGHLECTCQGFVYRGNCKHVQDVSGKMFDE